MFSATAEFYDRIYSTFKDYAAESQQIAALLLAQNPACKTVLDVACGTGEHALRLAQDGFIVDGLDLDPNFIAIARAKHPAGCFSRADMSDFALDRRYDAVICVFSSIAYLETLDRITQALVCFRKHLAPGGIAIVEPWFPPGFLDPKRVTTNVADAEELHIVRTSRIEIEGRLSRILFDYDITDSGTTRHVSEVHALGLFTSDEMMNAFRDAGMVATHDAKGVDGRGLFMGRAAS